MLLLFQCEVTSASFSNEYGTFVSTPTVIGSVVLDAVGFDFEVGAGDLQRRDLQLAAFGGDFDHFEWS